MRQEILNHLEAKDFAGFQLSKELPFTGSDQPLYIKNFKRIYVDNTQISIEPVVQILNGRNIESETTSVSVYFTTDAKTLPVNYSDLVAYIREARWVEIVGNYTSRTC
jgi:hypothetical protein